MPDENATNEEAITADDWGAAMAEQTTATDDWGSAMAEQAATASPPPASAKPHVLEQFGPSGIASTANDLDMILDIPVQLTVELGRTKMPIKNLLQLAQGSVVELAGMAGEPLDVMINGFLIAQGEVVVVNDKLGIRLTDIITPSERLRRLNR
ncbi:MAG: flagellar motor switch protein FliN [Gallionellales bacterium RIFCSPLOWO2_12_FULL_59_22]|nr:MAG: flagellar motor switch protein FliN [Gallionellales bacterium RIFCSPLOWO2_02_FULL_59_110]OGT10620.1 MAG: flagellar motor switch protein FliN [Gallionellales bacterium RIFCSPLOWO2_12_FULL_59_22]